jgi:hypothetical protein
LARLGLLPNLEAMWWAWERDTTPGATMRENDWVNRKERKTMTKIDVISDPSLGSPARYGVSELLKTLRHAGFDAGEGDTSEGAVEEKTFLVGRVGSSVFEDVRSDDIAPPDGPEAYALVKAATSSGEAICVVGSDDDGVKYGCFELAEQVEFLN